MYEFSDTIVAVSSPASEGTVIIRLTGPDALGKAEQIFNMSFDLQQPGIVKGFVSVDDELKLDAEIYLFLSPNSYTGQDVVEIHMQANSSVTEVLLHNFLAGDVRMAGPGEFTARAYLNGKMDLSQAEAVNEIIVSSNRIQLAAAERLLGGKLSQAANKICQQLLDCLSLIEAGLDFSEEDIEFISRDEAAERLRRLRSDLEELLEGSVSYEATIDLPSVGVAGAPNTGKSLLVNVLLGKKRSIVSRHCKTTRDILTSRLLLEHNRCVLFDCAGLASKVENIIDNLSQQAAIEALRRSDVVVFCVDLSKSDKELTEDITIRRLITPKSLIAVGTKADLIEPGLVCKRIEWLRKLFGSNFIAVSAKKGFGIDELRETIDKKLVGLALAGDNGIGGEARSGIGLTARHRRSVTEAIENVSQAIDALNVGSDEVAAMLIRAAFSSVGSIEQPVDEQILEKVFSRFCIGK